MKDFSENSGSEFEDKWKEAFEGKEMAPSAELWQKLDAHLANQESKKYRKGIFFYKWVAAASVFMALVIGASYYFNLSGSDQIVSEVESNEEIFNNENNSGENGQNLDAETQILLSENQNKPETSDSSSNDILTNTVEEIGSTKSENIAGVNQNPFSENENEEKPDLSQNLNQTQNKSLASQANGQNDQGSVVSNQTLKVEKGKEANSLPDSRDYAVQNEVVNNPTDNPIAMEFADHSTGTGNENPRLFSEADLNSLQSKGPLITDPKIEKPDVAVNKVIDFSKDPFRNSEESVDSKNLWAGVNVSTGHFDPNYGGRSFTQQDLAAFNSPDNLLGLNDAAIVERNGTGRSNSIGFNLGKQISTKWVLQSGLNFQNYNANGNTNAFIEGTNNQRSPAVTSYFSSAQAESQNGYNVNLASGSIQYNNQLDYLSVPLKAGYILVDKKFGVLLTAGVATDFLVRNRIISQTQGIGNSSFGPGDSIPFRSVYLNGLLGTQMRYQLTKQYTLTIEPNYSVAINSLTKQDSGLRSFPDVFSIGFGIKYIFR